MWPANPTLCLDFSWYFRPLLLVLPNWFNSRGERNSQRRNEMLFRSKSIGCVYSGEMSGGWWNMHFFNCWFAKFGKVNAVRTTIKSNNNHIKVQSTSTPRAFINGQSLGYHPQTVQKEIEDITFPCVDRNFISECSTGENTIHTHKRKCNILFIQKHIT